MALSKVNDGPCSGNILCSFGAICINISPIKSKCVCDIDCHSFAAHNNSNSNHSRQFVCGSDDITYPSECALKSFACRMQRPIAVKHRGMCQNTTTPTTPRPPPTSERSSTEFVTLSPIKRSTIVKTTLQDSNKSPSSEAIGNDSELIATLKPTQSTIEVDTSKIITIPGFSGDSFFEMPPLQAYNRLSIELDFKPLSDNGLLLYNGQTNNGEGDFVSLSINAGKVLFV